MTNERVQEYYEMLKFYYLKPDSDWTDKAKSIRTVAHDFYKEITRTAGTFADALKEFYKWNKYNEVSKAAFALKDQLNDVVHRNRAVDKTTYNMYYNMLVRLIYLATGILPDQVTMEFIGYVSVDELDGLNDEQKDAVLCDAQIVYVSAGPGTGKTHLLINKLLHYISASTSPEKIVALSYTNTAAYELGEKFRRAAFQNGVARPYEFYNGTLHSFCFKMMKSYYARIGQEFNFIIIDDTDIAELAEEFRIQLNDKYNIEEIKACFKSRLRSKDPQLQQLISEMKNRYNIISIDDILTNFIGMLDKPEFRNWFKEQISVLVIDEAQDLTELNYRIFDLLLQVNPSLKVFLVGDPRQNIFGFNGGSYVHLDKFLKGHTDIVLKNLTGTYRCPQPVCDYVNTFRFTDCENIPLRSVGGTTGTVQVHASEDTNGEALKVLDIIRSIDDLNSTAVLCQNLRYLQTFIEILGKNGVPYKVFGGHKLVKKHVKLFNHLLRIIDADNEFSMKRIDKEFKLQSDQKEGKNVRERFYNTPAGRVLKDIQEDIRQREARHEDVALADVASTLFDLFFRDVVPSVKEDLQALLELMPQYGGIADYLFSFAVDRETFYRFIEKDYAECKVPVTNTCLTISTIHSAKGLEWKHVIVMGLTDTKVHSRGQSHGNFPNMYFAPKDITLKQTYVNDLLKAMFVAATRTKGDLHLTYAMRNPWGYEVNPSRFLKGLAY